MSDLSFAVEGAAGILHAAAPLLGFKVRIVNTGLERIHAIALECRIQIDPEPRRPGGRSRDRLEELFSESSHWAQSSRPMPWTRAALVVPAFSGSTRCEIQAPASFDFNVAATKYFYGLEQESAPLLFEFSGTVFGDRGSASLPSKQARFALQAAIWQDLMDAYYPHSVWLRLPRDLFQRLNQYKIDQRIPTWEDVLERMLPAGQEAVH